MTKKCGFCEHFNKIQGIFGDCKAGMKTEYEGTTFSSNSACVSFKRKAQEERFESVSPFVQFMGMPSPLDLFLDRRESMQCAPEQPKEDRIPWENPLFKHKKPIRKVIPLKEAAEELFKRKKLNGNL